MDSWCRWLVGVALSRACQRLGLVGSVILVSVCQWEGWQESFVLVVDQVVFFAD